MLKLLTGSQHGYTMARLAGIQHEAFVAKTGVVPPHENITQYGDGSIIEITTTEEIEGETITTTNYGLVIDDTGEYYGYIADIHKSRLVDYVT